MNIVLLLSLGKTEIFCNFFEVLLDPQKLSLSKWGVRHQNSSTYSPKKGVLLQNSSTYSPPRGGPPLEFINIQSPKRGPPLEFINQKGSASRFHQPKRDPINQKGKGDPPLGTISMDLAVSLLVASESSGGYFYPFL